ncbi:DeoR family transcriptional regulator [Salinadaptatus halalkaliphilus]|uniref:DeoR family transcriptional regulator n=1 Tax=Salinadaptatus halalkaliphilus TaxID=2419781 RepID=A0A4S3TKS2_9EURY|nr:HNH endonuclease [Salinadaptatus halalkaliphilus]THE64752.1 DeoR family transcriptional regulator [Salinadaptatus halalkaliphilus]
MSSNDDTTNPGAATQETISDDSPNKQTSDEDVPSLTPSVRRFIRADRDNKCELCGADGTNDDIELEIHHRIQQADGGTDHPHNLLLICLGCHRRHHGNEPISLSPTTESETEPTSTPTNQSADSHTNSTECSTDTEPLPPRSTPNGADQEIIAYIEAHGPASTGKLAAALDYSDQYIRRQCWKLSGEQLIVPQSNDTWELKERASQEKIQIGLPDTPKAAKRAGRDEMIRRMSAHGMAHTQIVEITGYSRTTIDFAVNRARALRIDDDEDTTVDLATIASRLSALLELIDHAQLQSETSANTTMDDL